jgi:hypothetical protein
MSIQTTAHRHAMNDLETANDMAKVGAPQYSAIRANSMKISVTDLAFLHLFIWLQE